MSSQAAKCKCGKKAVYYRPWEGAFYCGPCLSRLVENNFKKAVREIGLIDAKKIAVGISGGKDSSVLLYLLCKIFPHRKNDFVAIIIDEGIKGYRPGGIMKARSLCKKLGVTLKVYSYKKELGIELDRLKKIKNKAKLGMCTYCGVFRRYLLNKMARKLGAGVLCLGHNLDDEAQSIIMNIVRGDIERFMRLREPRLRSKKFVPRAKPLIHVPAKEIVLYAVLNKIDYHHGECQYSYDSLRHDVCGMINALECAYPGTKQQIISFYKRLAPVFPKAVGTLKSCKKCGEPSTAAVCKACELLESLK